MTITAPQRPVMHSSEIRNGAVSYVGLLQETPVELLTGTPTATVTPTGPTLSNLAVSTSTTKINGTDVITGKAVTFKVLGGSAGTEYVVTITASTDTTPAQTLVRKVKYLVRDD